MLALLPGLRSLSFWGHLRWRPWGKAWGHLHSSHTQLVFLPSLTPPLEIQSRIQSSYSSSGAWQRASGSCFNGTGYIVIGRLLSFSLLLGRLNRFAVSLIILLPGHIHRNTRYSPKGKAMQEKQLGPWWRWWRCQKAGCIRLSTTPASATSGVPSGPHGTICEEFAEVHFSVPTLGQEMLYCVLEISVVITNFGGKNRLLHFIFLMIGSKFLQCTVRIKNVPVKAQLGIQGLVRILQYNRK